MNTAKKIVLPASKTLIVIGNICAGMLVVLKSDFFQSQYMMVKFKFSCAFGY